MATHARVEVGGMVLVAHDLKHPREVGQELELAALQHRSDLVWRRKEVPEKEIARCLFSVTVE